MKPPKDYEKILSSFAWANCNSIEVKQKGNFASWQKVKAASKKFDDFNLLFTTLKPDIVILMNNNIEDNLIKELTKKSPIKHSNYLWQYKMENPDINLYWTYHPAYLNKQNQYDSVLDNIINSVNG